jgi:HlyD family secretion protein
MKSSSPAPTDLAALIKAGGPRHSTRRRILIGGAAVLVALTAGLLWAQGKKSQQVQPTFATTPLHRADISLTITSTGNLEPINKVTIGSELSGTVSEVFVDLNDHVTKGQPLARLDTGKLAQQTNSSRAALKSAQAKLAQAQATSNENDSTLARQRELFRLSAGRSPSKSDMDSAEAGAERSHADLLSAQAAVEQAEAQVRMNETDLSKGIIRSPIDGIVLTRSIEPGQTVAASFTAPELFTIAENLSHMKLKVSVAEADIARLAKGQPATFTVDAWPNRTYSASVMKVSYGSSVTNNVVTYQTELEVANEDLSLRPGMTATADIHVAQRKNVLAVPTAALRYDPSSGAALPAAVQNKTFMQSLMPMPPRPATARPAGSDEGPATAGVRSSRIWILENNQPTAVEVRTGLSDGRQTEVMGESLAEGLPVITRTLPPSS